MDSSKVFIIKFIDQAIEVIFCVTALFAFDKELTKRVQFGFLVFE